MARLGRLDATMRRRLGVGGRRGVGRGVGGGAGRRQEAGRAAVGRAFGRMELAWDESLFRSRTEVFEFHGDLPEETVYASGHDGDRKSVV